MEMISRKICLAAIVVLVLLQNSVYNLKIGNNVCSRYVSYFDRQHSKNCWYNPDAFDNVESIITRRGYPIETHYVITSDGYILRVFRIPHGVGHNSTVQRKPILLLHGWATNSVLWVDLGNYSLAYLLADAGFDVWLPNYRGSYYSNQHVNLTTKSPGEYWNFSFHEQGIYDIPALLDHIYNRTKEREKIIIIGYSMGSGSSLIYGSLMPKHSLERVKVFILIAPTTSLTPTNSPLRYILPLIKIMQQITTLETLPVFLNQCEFPGYSMKTFYHYSQMSLESKFQMYDYGTVRNRQFYNSTKVPQYPLENIQVPVYSIIGTKDFAASVQDVKVLYERLGKEAKKYGYHVIAAKPEFAHNDYIISKHAKQYVGNHIIEFINSHLDNS